MKTTIIIDNGHGINTRGKRSPNGLLIEAEYTRRLAKHIQKELSLLGYKAVLLTPEEEDIPLHIRVKRANQYGKNSLLISLHLNAAGDGREWSDANGWSVHLALKSSDKSRLLASCLAEAAENAGFRVRKPRPAQPYWPQNLAICRDTLMPAVLTENGFMDNPTDYNALLSEERFQQLAAIHVAAIEKYIEHEK